MSLFDDFAQKISDAQDRQEELQEQLDPAVAARDAKAAAIAAQVAKVTKLATGKSVQGYTSLAAAQQDLNVLVQDLATLDATIAQHTDDLATLDATIASDTSSLRYAVQTELELPTIPINRVDWAGIADPVSGLMPLTATTVDAIVTADVGLDAPQVTSTFGNISGATGGFAYGPEIADEFIAIKGMSAPKFAADVQISSPVFIGGIGNFNVVNAQTINAVNINGLVGSFATLWVGGVGFTGSSFGSGGGGFTGSQGATGFTGSAGFNGSQGPIGYTGSAASAYGTGLKYARFNITGDGLEDANLYDVSTQVNLRDYAAPATVNFTRTNGYAGSETEVADNTPIAAFNYYALINGTSPLAAALRVDSTNVGYVGGIPYNTIGARFVFATQSGSEAAAIDRVEVRAGSFGPTGNMHRLMALGRAGAVWDGVYAQELRILTTQPVTFAGAETIVAGVYNWPNPAGSHGYLRTNFTQLQVNAGGPFYKDAGFDLGYVGSGEATMLPITPNALQLGNSSLRFRTIFLSPSNTTWAPINVGEGVAPSAPSNGDIWATSASVFARVNGATLDLGAGTGGTGYTGSQGALGYTGSQGAGFTGSQGTTGFTGSEGTAGTFGYTGSQGAGFTGSQGTTGFTGSQGAGFTGSQGVVGFTGSEGAMGPGGGFTGSQGATGFTGSAGTSAGFVGSQGYLAMFNVAETGLVVSPVRYLNDLSPSGSTHVTNVLWPEKGIECDGEVNIYVDTDNDEGVGFSGRAGAGSAFDELGRLQFRIARTGNQLFAGTVRGDVILRSSHGFPTTAGGSIFLGSAQGATTDPAIIIRKDHDHVAINPPLKLGVQSAAPGTLQNGMMWTTSAGVYARVSGATVGPFGAAGGVGYTGSQGVIGFTGSQGVIGFTGSQGVIGFTGSQGAGFTGSQGIIGFTGSQGIIGFTGSQGVIGTTGFTGSEGAQGPGGGYTGSQGVIGFTGSQGVIGFTGSQGAGFTGSQGVIGYTGSQGALGYTGSQGAGFTGSQGTAGAIGYTGSAGSGGGSGSALAASPTLYVTADAGLGGLSAGDPVTTWTDQGAGGLNLTSSGSARPTYRTTDMGDGLPFVEFDGSDDYLQNTAFAAASQDLTLYGVVRFKQGGSYPGVASFSDASNNDYDSSNRMSLEIGNSDPRSLNVSRGSANFLVRPWSAAGSGQSDSHMWGIVVQRWKASLMGDYRGELHWIPGWRISATYGFSNNFTFTHVVMGARRNGGSIGNYCRCDWRALALYEGVSHDDTTMRKMIYFLAEKWGVPI